MDGFYLGFFTDDRGKRHWRYRRDRAEPERVILEDIASYRAGMRFGVNADETVGRYLARWLSERQPVTDTADGRTVTRGSMKLSTWKSHEQHFRIHCLQFLGNLPMRPALALIPHLRTWQQELLASGQTVANIRAVRRSLNAAFEDAAHDGTWEPATSNPLRAVDHLRDDRARREEDRQPVAIDDAVIRHVLGVAQRVEPRWYPLFVLLAATGIDLGTALALRRDRLDVDLQRRHLRIRESVRRIDGQMVFSGPKADPRNRTIPLAGAVCAVLTAHEAALDGERAAAAAAGKPWPDATADLWFPRRDGEVKGGGEITNNEWQRVLVASGYPKRSIRLKDFRSTISTLLDEMGLDKPTQQAILGHAIGSDVTDKHYRALREPRRREAMEGVALRLIPGGREQSERTG